MPFSNILEVNHLHIQHLMELKSEIDLWLYIRALAYNFIYFLKLPSTVKTVVVHGLSDLYAL